MRKFILALVALLGLCGAYAVANYDATQGSGTTFKSFVVSSVHYAAAVLTNSSGTETGTATTPLRTDPTGSTTQPVSGSVTVSGTVGATQSGTWTVQPGNTANTTPWLFTGSGSAGSAASGVLSVQGIASMTPLLANPGTAANWGVGATGSAVPANGLYGGINVAGNLRGATGLALGSTFSQTIAIVDGSGNQVTSFGGSGGTSSNYSSAFPSAGTAVGFSDGTNMVAAKVGAIANVTAATNMLNTITGCQYNATPVTVTDTRYQSLQCDVNGFAKVNVTNANANGQATMANSSPVVIASNQTANALWGQGATGSAAPANAVQAGVIQSGATGGLLKAPIMCDSHVFKHITSATDTVAVQGVASQSIYICAWRSRAAGVATWYLENTASTNNNCSSTLTQITGVATEAANTGETWGNGFWSGLKNTSGNGLCINSTGTGGVDIDIWYTQF